MKDFYPRWIPEGPAGHTVYQKDSKPPVKPLHIQRDRLSISSSLHVAFEKDLFIYFRKEGECQKEKESQKTPY